MYEELVNRLRNAYEADTLDNQKILLESADAIEKLSKELIELKLLTCGCCEPTKEET